MRLLTTALLTFLLASCGGGFSGVETVQVGGRPAVVNFAVGAQLDAPLIIALHGSSGNSIQFQAQSDLVSKAKDAGLRLALPNGQKWDALPTYYGFQRSWNSGNCCWDRPEDDIAYLRTLITQLQVGAHGKGRRVVLVGHSNGSMMAYALMCAHPDLVHAVVGVAGTVSFTACAPSRTLVHHIHGTMDETVPLAGAPDVEGDPRYFESLAFQQSLFNRAGIRDTTTLLPGIGHDLPDIDAALITELGFSIGDLAVSLAQD